MGKVKPKSTEEKLMPNSVVIQVNGDDIRVPSNAEEAAAQNIILVSQFRHVLQNAMKRYKDMEMIPTPKELRDMAGAIRDCNEACSAVFENIALPMNEGSPQKKEEEAPIDFSSMPDVTPKESNSSPSDKTP